MEKAVRPIDGKVLVSVSRDGMQASITLVRPQNGGEDVTTAQIRAALAEKNVVYGLDEIQIDEAGNRRIYGKDIPVAQGKPPEKGKSAVLEFLFETEVDHRPKELDDGSVNYRDLGIIQHVEAGQKLCEKTPATKGIDGVNVYGKPVRAQAGRDLPMPRGKNTVPSEDGLFLLAEKVGHVEYISRRVNVFDLYTISQDVGPGTGNISFEGSVLVKGSVLSGYAVEAHGDITIKGACEAATLRSGGTVIIGEGINRGLIEAAGDVRSEYLQACNVSTEGNVYSGSVINSTIRCGGSIIVTGFRGTIVGGSVSANAAIESMFIGAKNSIVPTYVEVGLSPQVQKRIRELPEEINRTVETISSLDKVITLLGQLAKAGKLDEEKRQKFLAATNTREVEYNRYLRLLEEKDELEEKSRKLGYGRVVAKGKISPGVRIVIGPHQMTISDDLPRPRITRGSDGLLVNSAV